MHAIRYALTVFDLDPTADPPKVLAIGPDLSGNLLEIIWLELESEDLIIHAMPLRRAFYHLLPPPTEEPK